ncbi:hypothetical protein [Sulfitobacter sp. TMED3]|uniref:hypothetical protein n=1 Tax=Sulfitobacter sp. TMED3 TaxID=1986591 RepID=UPI0025797F13|nr:hypothetical protein [Sulfitobacter sp. TMED3]
MIVTAHRISDPPTLPKFSRPRRPADLRISAPMPIPRNQKPEHHGHNQRNADIREQSEKAVQPAVKFIENQAGVGVDFFHGFFLTRY